MVGFGSDWFGYRWVWFWLSRVLFGFG
jgi:hypothetical protein